MAPLNEVVSTRPSCSSRVSASRIGVLLTPSCSASAASRSGSPGASLRSTMADFSSSYTQSVTFRRSCRPLKTDTGWVFPSSRERMAMTTTSQPSDHLCRPHWQLATRLAPAGARHTPPDEQRRSLFPCLRAEVFHPPCARPGSADRPPLRRCPTLRKQRDAALAHGGPENARSPRDRLLPAAEGRPPRPESYAR